jgi:prepilin signal peptidase PulO-like enzyme (type II secretory pathway)
MVTLLPIWWLCHWKKNKVKWGSSLPFGPFLALGAVSYLLFFKTVVDEYLARLEILLG